MDQDPDAADASALEVAADLPEEPSELANPTDSQDLDGLQITGLRTVAGAGHMSRGSGSKFSGLFESSDESDDSSLDEDDAGRDHTLSRDGGDYDDPDPHHNAERSSSRRAAAVAAARRPSTTEAAVRKPLDDGDSSTASSTSDDDLEVSDLPDDLPDSIERKLVLESAAQQGPFGDPPRGLGDDDDDDDDSSEDELEIRARRPS